MNTKTSFNQQTGSSSEFNDYELQATMRDFLEEEEKDRSSVWNVATIAGLAMFFVSMLYVLQLVGLFSGLTDWMTVLPIIGTLLIVFVGFGFFVGDRKRVKRILKKQRQKRKQYFEKAFGDVDDTKNESFSLKNDLFGKSKQSKKKNPFTNTTFDEYALHQSKKLYKSRSDKKIAGICGGLSKYFGIDANIIRFLAVVLMFFGIGSTFFVYIILMVVLDKEPVELLADHDLNY